MDKHLKNISMFHASKTYSAMICLIYSDASMTELSKMIRARNNRTNREGGKDNNE